MTSSAVSNLFKSLISGNRLALARSITLVESVDPAKRPLIAQLMDLVYRHNSKHYLKKTFRIGISGPPGAGKSTFINALTSFMLRHDDQIKVSILTIDPTSPTSGGSLLADTFRMDTLCQYADPDRIFIRSSPSSGFLGGVHRRTPYAIQLCEATGYDFTFVETVGTGQSEVAVSEMVDCFCVLVPPAAGDEIQAIKKGIIEMADLIVVTKNDPIYADVCKRTYRDYVSASKLFPPKSYGWKPLVSRVSSKTGDGIDKVWNNILKFQKITKENGHFQHNRIHQFKSLYRDEVQRQLYERVFENPQWAELSKELKHKVEAGKLWPSSAAREFIATVFDEKKQY